MTKYCSNSTFEDTINCYVYTVNNICNDKWDELHLSLNDTISTLSQEYIWQKDDFKLYKPDFEEKRKDVPYYLSSTTCFGDNIEDEWFIVYMVIELTKLYPDIIVQIEDSDGDFLLIEAANYLPSWANPDSTDNRVFIHKGKVHIIDPSVAPLNSTLTLNDALVIIKEKSKQIEASLNIQHAILQRVGDYPQKIESLCHRAHVTIPAELAALLLLKPSLVSPISTTYCNIDAVDMNYCKDTKFEDNVTVKLKFTKYLYAMLLHSKNIKTRGLKDFENDKKCQLGMKLVYGYQIITRTPTKDISTSLEYKKFMNSLIKNGYFKDNLEGSKEYKRLLAKANEYFLNMESSISSYLKNMICAIKSTEEYNDLLNSLHSENKEQSLEEDDEEWLNVHPDQLNDFLNLKYGNQTNSKSNNDSVTSKLSNFLKQTSDFEGIEKREDIDSNDNIQFDSELFVKSLEKMLNIISSNHDVTDDSDSNEDYEENETTEIDDELALKLHDLHDFRREDTSSMIVDNLRQSMKEEGLSGPSSNILRSVNMKKNDFLDSDDE